jgi:hypothetical protein
MKEVQKQVEKQLPNSPNSTPDERLHKHLKPRIYKLSLQRRSCPEDSSVSELYIGINLRSPFITSTRSANGPRTNVYHAALGLLNSSKDSAPKDPRRYKGLGGCSRRTYH